MNLLFPALELRFKSNRQLVRVGRKLYQGTGGLGKAKPYATVGRTGGAPIRTFGADLELYDLNFQGFSAHEFEKRANAFCAEMIRTFDSAGILGPFTIIEATRTNTTGPNLVDGVYQFTLTYTYTVQRSAKVPAERMV